MNKLFATTALVGALSLTSAANALDVKLGGFIDFQAGFTDQDLDNGFNPNTTQDDVKFQNDTELHVTVGGTADNGLKYGAVIELEADITADDQGEGFNADRTFLYLESSAGRLELGGNVGAEETLKVDAASIARATGGIDGNFFEYVDLTTGGAFVVRPDLPAQYGTTPLAGATEDATKITYYTPRFSGFQLGASYTPDIGDVGTSAGWSANNIQGQSENNFHLGANYTGEFEGVGVDFGATWLLGDGEGNNTEDLNAYNVGGAVTVNGFSLAGSYGDWDDSLQTLGSNVDSDYWTAGAAYATGPFGISVTYLNSETGSNEFENISVGADYQLAPGLVPYVEVSFFDADSAQTTPNVDNDGSVVIIGTQLNF